MSLTRSIRRPLLLSGLVLLPLAWAPLDAFSKDHAFLINASPSLPNWAFWLDKHAPIERGSLFFFEPPQSELVERHFGKGPQMFGKRVLGMPGDVVRHEGDAVFINGKQVASLLEVTRLGVPLTRGPEGAIPEGCYYAGTDHPRGLDSRYGAIGFICREQILGSGRAIL
ncbi:S26 family signal peptidase [Pelagerythrobacter marinus]|uniref:S26 family signal peptidase n=1 Tax=Pelagerythrobacter marinus TaxID=538382 RepID=UPI000C592938|nr:S26 family signal peptidase [Pelagerythrobacter marinus]MAF57894.1 conjugal transfer protein TraF [Ponticaulis sp.]WPZ05425.1 S26 family signal peptidase [Pelagerythrobacter marinus]|tara:strand:+ start:979 stop:1485 length:507 start_codon:yes stop_codon:yes gene_type:complete